jgi:gamma-glutamyltranspeptidase / glutathione hydrolase
MKRLFLLLTVLTLATCTTLRNQKSAKPLVLADSAIVVTAHPLASKVGLDILEKGGNAVDASIAVQFALAVVYPSAGNLGGGGFMVFRKADGTATTLDYREKAPGQAKTNMFLDEKEMVVSGLSETTHLASGVPGTVAGLWEAHQKYGTARWSDLIQPAIDLASNGFALTQNEADGLNSIQVDLKANNITEPSFLIGEWKKGDVLRLADLANTLIRIRDNGASGFYEGKTADDIVAEMKCGNGIITHKDLKNYSPVWREPIKGTHKNITIISMPPPSSGGVALIQLLKSIEPYPVGEWAHNSVESTHLFTEAERRVYADRATYLGDPDFYKVPLSSLLKDEYIKNRMSTFDPKKATPSASVKGTDSLQLKESEQTTHLSIVDSKGNAVAVTTTLNDAYGSKIVVAGSGFLLNNEMDDFSVKPGHPNMYGAIGGEANKILPNKRMLSSMTPTILEKDGKLFMVVGTPGGTTIITSVFQTIVNVVEYKMSMQEAVSAKRTHSQWLPDEIFMEERALTDAQVKSLELMGHKLTMREGIGRVDAILIRDDDKLEGGADPRGDDTAMGY